MGDMDIDDREVSASGLADANQACGKRRRWPEALKRELVAALSEPGASVSIVARRYDLNTNQLFKWRRQFGVASAGASVEPVRLLPVEITPASVSSVEARVAGASGLSAAPPGSIEIALRGGTRVRITGTVDPAAVSAAVGAVMAARRRG
jgi:transposase